MTPMAKTYGEALYALARDEQLDQRILEELEMTAGLFRENPDYVHLLSLPSLPKQERCAMVDESFRDRVHPYLLNFLKILVERGAPAELSGCAEAYRRRYHEDHGILEVTAVTAVPLDEALSGKLHQKLEEKTGKTVVLNTRVEPDVLGGVRLEMEGRRLDGTVRSRLDAIEKLLHQTVL